MPFKMMSPLNKMATTAMKTVGKSAVKKLSPDQKKLDKNKSGDLDSQDFKMLRSSNKMQPSGLKAIGGSTMKSEKSTPLFVNSPAKEKDPITKAIDKGLSTAGDAVRTIASRDTSDAVAKDRDWKKNRKKGESFSNYTERKNKEKGSESKTEVRSESKTEVRSGSRTEGGQKSLKEINAAKKKAAEEKAAAAAAAAEKAAEKKTDPNKKLTYSQAWDKMTDAAQGKYESKADFIKAAKAYNNRGKTTETTGPTEAEKKAAEEKKLKEQKKLKTEKKAADNSDKIVKEAQLEKSKKEAEKVAAEKIRLAKAEEYNKKNLKTRSRSREKVKVDVVKDKKTGARLKTKTRTRKDGTVKTKVKETKIIGGVASKTRKVKDTRKEQKKKDKKKNRSRVSVGSSPG